MRDDVERAREANVWRVARQRDPGGDGHRVDFDIRRCVLQRPLHVLDVEPQEAPGVEGEERVTLGEPVVERSDVGAVDAARRTIPGAEFRAAGTSPPITLPVELTISMP